jgi:hypothetical protein
MHQLRLGLAPTIRQLAPRLSTVATLVYSRATQYVTQHVDFFETAAHMFATVVEDEHTITLYCLLMLSAQHGMRLLDYL